jgi:26S proteasome regulatory subunit N7
MPLENLEEEGLEKNPNLELALWKFLLSLPDHSGDKKLQSKLMEAIIGDSMYIFTNYVFIFFLLFIFLW